MHLIIRCLASLWRHCGRSKCTLCILEVQTKTIKKIRRKNIFSSWRKIIFRFWKFWKFWNFSKNKYFLKIIKTSNFSKIEIFDFVVDIFGFSIFEKKIWFFKFLRISFFFINWKCFFSKMKKYCSSGFFLVIRYIFLLHSKNVWRVRGASWATLRAQTRV